MFSHHSNHPIASSVRIAVSPAPTFHIYRFHANLAPRKRASRPNPAKRRENPTPATTINPERQAPHSQQGPPWPSPLRRSCRCPTCWRRVGSFSAGSARPGTRTIAAGARASWPACCTNTGCAGCGGCCSGKTGSPSCPEPGAAVVSRLDSGVRRNDEAKIARLWAPSTGCRPWSRASASSPCLRARRRRAGCWSLRQFTHADAVRPGADAGGEGCPGPGNAVHSAVRGEPFDRLRANVAVFV